MDNTYLRSRLLWDTDALFPFPLVVSNRIPLHSSPFAFCSLSGWAAHTRETLKCHCLWCVLQFAALIWESWDLKLGG